jgi:hypothetical protein
LHSGTRIDEISFDKPDISIIVLLAGAGWPGQIDYSATDGKPTDEQSNSRRMSWPMSSPCIVPGSLFRSFLSRRGDETGGVVNMLAAWAAMRG